MPFPEAHAPAPAVRSRLPHSCRSAASLPDPRTRVADAERSNPDARTIDPAGSTAPTRRCWEEDFRRPVESAIARVERGESRRAKRMASRSGGCSEIGGSWRGSRKGEPTRGVIVTAWATGIRRKPGSMKPFELFCSARAPALSTASIDLGGPRRAPRQRPARHARMPQAPLAPLRAPVSAARRPVPRPARRPPLEAIQPALEAGHSASAERADTRRRRRASSFRR